MIRKFLSVAIFTATITLASFGQDVFGRNDLIAWAYVIQEKGPQRVEIALQKTDEALAQLAPEAGGPQPAVCMFGRPNA